MKKKIFILISAILLTLSMFTSVKAITVAEAGETVEQVGEYNSTRLIAGNKVANKATVDGLLFAAGNDLVLEGSSSYGFYAGNNILINEKVEKDLFVAGSNVTIGENAVINRDAYVFGTHVKINTTIGRDLRVSGAYVDLSGAVINGDVYTDASSVTLDEKTVITGKLSYLKDTKINGISAASVGETESRELDEIVIEHSFKDEIKDFLISAISSFCVLAVLFFIIPSAKERLNNLELSFGHILKSAGIGLIVIILVPILAIVALFPGIFTPLALITLAVYVIGIYLATLLIYYIVGNLISTKLFKKDNMYLALLVGIIIVKLVKLIPILGGLVTAISLFYGLGLIYKFIVKKEK